MIFFLFQFSSVAQGQVVRMPVNANPGLKVNRSINFSCSKVFSLLLICFVKLEYYPSSKLKGKQYKQKTSPKNYKTEIKILANHGLAKSGF